MPDALEKLIVPNPLIAGDTIGIAAPAGPFDPAKFEQGINLIEKQGYRVHIPERIYDSQGYLAGSDEDRAGILNQLFADVRIKAIICARGGYGSMRILSMLDYQAIAANPKIFVGFSDITALLVTIFEKTRMTPFHGPVVTTIADEDETSLAVLFDVLTTLRPYSIEPDSPFVVSKGSAAGRIVGGNLTTLCYLVGTPFQSYFDDRILFLEDVGEAVYRIDRMLTQMKLAGCFDRIKGIILGDFEGCGQLPDIYYLFGDIFKDMAIPILGGFSFGHGKTNLTIPIGWHAELDTTLMTIKIRPDSHF